MNIRKYFSVTVCFIAGLIFIIGMNYTLGTDFFNIYAHPSENNITEKAALFFTLTVSAIEVFFHRKKIFTQRISPFRIFISVFSSTLVILSLYQWKIATGMGITLLLLCIFHGIATRQFYKPNLLKISMFLFFGIGFLGILWANDAHIALEQINFYPLLIFIPIASCFYKVSDQEKNAFGTITFMFLKNILTLCLFLYTLLIIQYHKSFFSFITLNKHYLDEISHYDIISWSKMPHPSRISWLFLIVGVIGYVLHSERKTFISKSAVIQYGVSLAAFSLMVQARVTLLGILILGGAFIYKWVMFSSISLSKKIAFNIGIALMVIFSIYVISHQPYFFDKYRSNMYISALHDFWKHPFFGGGTGHQLEVIQRLNYPFNKLHNDILTTAVNWGLLGLLSFSIWMGSIFFYGIKKSYFLGIFLIITFGLFALTDGILNEVICLPFFLFFIL